MAILGGGPLSSVPISGLEGAAAAVPDNVIRPTLFVGQAVARANTRVIFQPITFRGDPFSEPPPSVATPGPIVIPQTGPSVIQAQKFTTITKRAHLVDDPQEVPTRPTVVTAQATARAAIRTVFQPALFGSKEDVFVFTATPGPVVTRQAVVRAAIRTTFEPITSRGSLQDAPQDVPTRPVFIGQAVPRALVRDALQQIVKRGGEDAVVFTASPQPIVVTSSFVNTLARAIVKQITMRGDPTAAPAPPPTEPPGPSAGTLPGHWGKRPRWWIELEHKRKKEARFPDLPPPPANLAPPWKLKTVTKSTRRILDTATRDWRARREKAKRAEDALIAAIIITLMAEQDKDNDE